MALLTYQGNATKNVTVSSKSMKKAFRNYIMSPSHIPETKTRYQSMTLKRLLLLNNDNF